MKSSVFRFKAFEVDQTGCAMKINTDGVLLGAMSHHDTPQYVLDIGTGTGVIALMLAQRFPAAYVDAVEIDSSAAATAQRNFQNSSFSDRLHTLVGSFENIEKTYQYDLIVSNPPFYTNSLHNPDERKKTAKHANLTFFETMLAFAHKCLQAKGILQLILPTELATEITALAKNHGLYLIQTISIRSFENSEIIRQIISLQKGAGAGLQTLAGARLLSGDLLIKQAPDTVQHQQRERDFVIYAEKGVYSEQYSKLLQPFFLAF